MIRRYDRALKRCEGRVRPLSLPDLPKHARTLNSVEHRVFVHSKHKCCVIFVADSVQMFSHVLRSTCDTREFDTRELI